MKRIHLVCCIVLLQFFCGCIKTDIDQPRQIKRLDYEKDGFIIEYAIPERKCLYGLLEDSTGYVRKVEYNLVTKTYRNTNYMKLSDSYSATKPDAVYICSFSDYKVDIYNFLDSSLYKSYTYSEVNKDVALANGKIYIVRPGFIGRLYVMDIETNNELSHCNVSNLVDAVFPSPDGSRIYTGDYQSWMISLFNNGSVNNVYGKSGNLPFKKFNHRMSLNGKYSITKDGWYLNDSLVAAQVLSSEVKSDNIHDFSISTSGKSVGFFKDRMFHIYDSISIYHDLVLAPKIYNPYADDYFTIASCVMYFIDNKHFAALNYELIKNAVYYRKAVIVEI